MSKIQWTTDSWNPTIGCSKASEGCKNCYAIREAYIRSHNPNPAIKRKFDGTVYKTEGGALNWTGNINFGQDALTKPLKRKGATLWFVNSMSDLFHPNMPEEYIDEVYAVMALCRQHVFQVLTKHPARMVEYFGGNWTWRVAEKLKVVYATQTRQMFELCKEIEEELLSLPFGYEMPNVWHGVSVENQKWADERIPLLAKVPSVLRFLSCEPLLGNVRIPEEAINKLHWVIVGGESGADARPMHPRWAQHLRNQCQAWGLSFFFKQWGEWAPQEHWKDTAVRQKLYMWEDGSTEVDVYTKNGVGGQIMGKVGKKKAGEMLDFSQYKEWPEGWETHAAIACKTPATKTKVLP